MQNHLQCLSLNFVFDNVIVGQIQIRCGSTATNNEANRLMTEMAACTTVPQLKQSILLRLNDLAEKGNIYLPKYT